MLACGCDNSRLQLCPHRIPVSPFEAMHCPGSDAWEPSRSGLCPHNTPMCRSAATPGSAGQLTVGAVSICTAGAEHSGCRHPPAPSRSVHAWPLQTDTLDPRPGPAAALCVPAYPWAACPCRWRNDCAGAASKRCLLHKGAVPRCRQFAAQLQPASSAPDQWPACSSCCAAAAGNPCLPSTAVADSYHSADVASLPYVPSPHGAVESPHALGTPLCCHLCAPSSCWPGVISSSGMRQDEVYKRSKGEAAVTPSKSWQMSLLSMRTAHG